MHFAFTEDQRLFQETVRDLLATQSPGTRLREVGDSAEGRDQRVWSQLAEMGVIGVTAPEAAGGFGGSELDLVLLLEELGFAGCAEPVLETTAVVIPTLVAAGRIDEVARLASGEISASVSTPRHPYANHAETAGLLLVADAGRVAVVEPGEAKLTTTTSLDAGRRLSIVDVAAAAGETLDVDVQQIEDRGALASAAMLVGTGRRIIEMAAEYAGDRKQFGVPIGSFQAVKHLLADALMAVDFAGPMVYRAAYAAAHDEADQSRWASMAKAFASEAADGVWRAGLQVHGAIGYTTELDLQIWLKRMWVLSDAWGSATVHRRRVAADLGLTL